MPLPALATLAAGATLLGMGAKAIGALGRGFSAGGADTKKAASAAEKIKADQEALLRRETESQFSLATQNMLRETQAVNLGARESLMKTFREKGSLIKQTGGIANIGEIEAVTSEAYASTRGRNKYALDKIGSQYSGTITGIDIARERSLAGINERFNARIAEIGQIPDTFWEGMFGSNQQISGRSDLYG